MLKGRGIRCWRGEGSGRGIRCWREEGSGAGGERDQVEGSGAGGKRDQVMEGRRIRCRREEGSEMQNGRNRKSLKQHFKVFFSDKKVFQLKLFATGGQIQYIMVFQNTFLCTFSI